MKIERLSECNRNVLDVRKAVNGNIVLIVLQF